MYWVKKQVNGEGKMAASISSTAQRILAEHRVIAPTGPRPILKREELNEQIEAFITNGGKIDHLPSVEVPHHIIPTGYSLEGVGA